MSANASMVISAAATSFLAMSVMLACSLPARAGEEAGDPRRPLPMIPRSGPDVPDEVMKRIYEEVKTPHKVGIVVRGDQGKPVDCPSVFRHAGRWFMIYVCMNDVGYETHLAASDNLVEWKPLGKILQFREGKWDAFQAAGGVALQNTAWAGSCALQRFDGKYWISYLGGALQGYETEPLSVGMAWTLTPDQPGEWNRIEESPVLTSDDEDARSFERATLYRSHIIEDPAQTLGFPFVMFYNAKQKGEGVERIGMAASKDMIHWQRYGTEPIIDNGKGISGDPQVVRIGDIWVLFYFGAFWKPNAFDTFACSYDLAHWTQWTGPNLVEPSKPWDSQYAHKPWLVKHNGIVYHFYCAVGSEGRAIALATSQSP